MESLQQPPVVGFAELVQMLNVSRTRVRHLMAMADFPTPIAALAMGPVWTFDDVSSWCELHGRTVYPVTTPGA